MEHAKMTMERLKPLLDNKNIGELRQVFSEYNIVNMSELVAELENVEVLFVFKTLRKNISSQIFAYLPYNKQEYLIEAFTAPEIQELLDHLASDDIVDFMNEMPSNIVKRILQSAKLTQRTEINELLNYCENSCGSIMNTNYITLKRNESVERSIERLKRRPKIDTSMEYAYITDTKRQLIGYLSLKQLLFLDSESKIDDIMQTDVIFVNTKDKQAVASQMIEKYDITAIPVVNDQGELAGVITVDDIFDVIKDEVNKDIQRMNAITPMKKAYLKTSVFSLYRQRVIYLLLLMLIASFSVGILSAFEGRMQSVAYLSLFIPMLMIITGNASDQSSAIIMRSLTVKEIKASDTFKVLLKELQVSLLCGLTLGIVNLVCISIFMGKIDFDLALIVSLTVTLTIMIAKLLGCILPIAALKLKLNPVIMSGPLITTLVDVIALLVYLLLASCFLR